MAVQIAPRAWVPPGWDDLIQPAYSLAFDSTTGRMALDIANGAVSYAANARYPEESLFIPYQLSHATVPGSTLDFHLHWFQGENADPNWLMEYRMFANGEAPPGTWQKQIPSTQRAFTYTSGTITQITAFPQVALSGLSSLLSAWVQVRLYRDTANESGLFAGADAYSAAATVLSPDAHVLRNRFGSMGNYSG